MPRCGHVPGSTGSNAYNTGMMILRNRPATLAIMREWHLRLASPNECAARYPDPKPQPLTVTPNPHPIVARLQCSSSSMTRHCKSKPSAHRRDDLYKSCMPQTVIMLIR